MLLYRLLFRKRHWEEGRYSYYVINKISEKQFLDQTCSRISKNFWRLILSDYKKEMLPVINQSIFKNLKKKLSQTLH
jgi:hypothetical protein